MNDDTIEWGFWRFLAIADEERGKDKRARGFWRFLAIADEERGKNKRARAQVFSPANI